MKTPKHTPVTPINPVFARKPLAYLIGSVAMVSCLAGTQANAQESKPVAAEADTIQVVEIIGTRQAEENAINRKKKAKTAIDSIVAEDVGTLPDQNVGEAISRIAGIALDRGDMGEGVGVTVRGSGPDLTRVEIDGQGVQSGGGASGAMNGDISQGGSGRAQGFRDLNADLIKSVDVIKGSTADMNEGSLGGGIQIKTRSALDFKKKYTSIKLSASQGSINTDISPNYNVIFADKFFDERLGVLINTSGSKVSNEGHIITQTDNGRGYTHAADFDNSPEKTFSFNPATVTTDALGTTPITTFALKNGGVFSAPTPLQFVTAAGAAKTKADCYAAFPAFSAAQIADFSTTTIANNARNQRSNELISCLNQWNDWTPSNIRYQVRRDYEERRAVDVRLDFKVTDDFSVYTKISESKREIANTVANYSLGGTLTTNPATNAFPAVGNTPAYSGNTFVDTAGVRTAINGSGYYTLPNNVSYLANAYPVTNMVTNIIPGSVVVDENHHVTSYKFSNGTGSMDQSDTDMVTESKYFQIGGNYIKDNLEVEFLLGKASSEFSRIDIRTGWSTYFGEGTMSVLSNGLWNYTLPAGSSFDQTNPALYARINPIAPAATAAVAATYFSPAVPAYTSAQKALVSYSQPALNAQALRLNETGEQTAKIDATYKFEDQIPFLTSVKGGLNYRETDGTGWGGGGATITPAVGTFGQPGFVPPVILPNNTLRGNVIACENTAGSLGAGGQPCVYGYSPKLDYASSRAGNFYVSQATLQDYITQSMKSPSATFFGNLPDRGNLLTGWNEIDVRKFYELIGAKNYFSLECMKECTASDGKVYKQPFNTFTETTLAGYLMADFEVKDLPFGMELTANAGVRAVQNDVYASGTAKLISTIKVPGVFDPANPNAAAGLSTTDVSRQVAIERTTTDVLPSINLGLWAIPDELVLRYSRGTTVARPNVFHLLPQGDCTFNETRLDTDDTDGSGTDMTCTIFGNPSVQAQRNINQNLSLEWYPSKGFMLSAAAFRQTAKIGPATAVTRSNVRVFEGSDQVDPQTGVSLSDLEYTLRTYVNGPGIDRKGYELAGKASFTFLPWLFKYTGIDINTSVLESSDSVAIRDLNSGDAMPPTNESSYSYNLALWYDDGHLTARIAYQARGETFINLTGVTGTQLFNYPAAGVLSPRFPYNPAGPNFKDATSFIDAKIAYKFDSGLDIFIEGRNLGLSTTTTSSGGYYDFADGTASINDFSYFGRRVTAGINYKF